MAKRIYPYYGQFHHSELTVYFTSEKTGKVVVSGSNQRLGYQSFTWAEQNFTPCPRPTGHYGESGQTIKEMLS